MYIYNMKDNKIIYKMDKKLFMIIYDKMLSGIVFYNDLDINTIKFKFITKKYEKHVLEFFTTNNILVKTL